MNALISRSIDVIKKNNIHIVGNLEAKNTLLFVHGFGTDQSAWNKIVPAFSDNYRVVLMDNVGAGNSDHEAFVASRYQNLDKYADDVLDICDTLKLENVTLVGHSVGGMIGVLAGIRAPENFCKLILLGVSPRYLNDEGYSGGMTNADIRDIFNAIQENFSDWALHFSKLSMQNPSRPELAEMFADHIRAIPKNRVLTVLQSILHTDYRSELGKLQVPSLIIQGEHDLLVPMEVADYMHQHIKSSQLTRIQATGHLPHLSAPEAVIDAIRDFL